MAVYSSFILVERINKFLLMLTVGHILEVSCIRISFKNELGIRLFVPFYLFLPQQEIWI
jgi:hypothetical protein